VNVDQESGPLALGAVHLIEDVTIVAEGEEAAAALHHILEQIVAELILGRELGAVEPRAQIGERGHVEVALGELGLVGELVPAAVILVLDTAIGLAVRRQVELGLVIASKKRASSTFFSATAARWAAAVTAWAAALPCVEAVCGAADGCEAAQAASRAVEASRRMRICNSEFSCKIRSPVQADDLGSCVRRSTKSVWRLLPRAGVLTSVS
jgi:hypothetical protein